MTRDDRTGPTQRGDRQLDRFAEAAMALSNGPAASDLATLHAWSVANPDAFWPLAWEQCGMVGAPGGTAVVRDDDPLEWRFFPEASLNVAETFLRNADDRPAIVAVTETGQRRTLTRAELKARVKAAAAALTAAGVGPGERVAGLLPNGPEAAISALACAWVGAVWSSVSPEFGVDVVLDRFGQIEPKVLIAAGAYSYNGKHFDVADRVAQIVGRLPTLRQVVTVGDFSTAPDGSVAWDEWLDGTGAPPAPVRQGFDAPLYILYSSGTTGKPKCFEHGGPGTLLRQMVEQQLQADLRPGDVMFYFSTTSWMMWNWLMAGLASEATIVLFDGNPMYPGPERLFDLARDERVTHFGVSAKYIDSVAKASLRPRDTHDLSAMRVVFSTGSPLGPAGFEHVWEDWKPDVLMSSISGGTDILGLFIGATMGEPVVAGRIPGPALGVDATVVDDEGREVFDQAGELVCRQPHPSMPLRFLNDPGKERYRNAYFDRFPGWWRQGDFAIRHSDGGFEVLGRSDATLNPGGVRIGTAEIYRVVEALPEVAEAIVVGQDVDGDVRVVLFVVLAEGATLDDALCARIRDSLKKGASPRHVPAAILSVPEVPRTRSGKIAELAVRDVVNKRPVRDLGGLANPQVLDAYADRPELAV